MKLGQLGEDLVWQYYSKLGYKLLERNYVFRFGVQAGEIDLILQKENELVFVEVKARRNSKFGSAAESVDLYKQRKLVRTTKLYLKQHPKFQALDYRIDVAVVDVDNSTKPVIIIPNAIEDLD